MLVRTIGFQPYKNKRTQTRRSSAESTVDKGLAAGRARAARRELADAERVADPNVRISTVNTRILGTAKAT